MYSGRHNGVDFSVRCIGGSFNTNTLSWYQLDCDFTVCVQVGQHTSGSNYEGLQSTEIGGGETNAIKRETVTVYYD